jgi:hypothetical protein
MKPIPDNIKQILGQLQGPQQVALKAYIGTLRAEMKDLEAQLHALQNPAPDHGHYHGHELCTADHGHSEHAHGHKKEHEPHHHHKEHDHHEHHHKEHDHKHNDHCEHKDHDHKDHHKEHHDHHEHKHEHHHGQDEVPAWKKKAMESDPSAAPFGGSWNAESNVNANHGKH